MIIIFGADIKEYKTKARIILEDGRENLFHVKNYSEMPPYLGYEFLEGEENRFIDWIFKSKDED